MKYSNSCRICLGNGGVYPIFNNVKSDEVESIHGKLSTCLNEKIEDVEGYPCNICGTCKSTLDIVYNFITKYKESCRILSLVTLVKEECNSDNDSNYDDNTEHIVPQNDEDEIYIEDIKREPKIEYEFSDDANSLQTILKPLSKELKITKVNKRVRRSDKKNVAGKDRTNRIASSVLEGTCAWSGEQWCFLSRNTRTKYVSQISKSKNKIITITNPVKTREISKTTLCDICGEILESPNDLPTHKRKIHYKQTEKCNECGKIYASIVGLKRHKKRVHITEKNHFCPICKTGFYFKGDVTSHVKNVHNKHLKPTLLFKCQFCVKTFTTRMWAQSHERSVHTGERPEVCNVCDAAFTNRKFLRQHMRLHTGVKPYKCPVCGQGFAQHGNMKSHIAHNHKLSDLDSKTFLLSAKTSQANKIHRICKKRELKIVKKKIPKEKKIPVPKLCDLCGDIFKNQDKLRKHKLNMHFKKPAKCEECDKMCSSERELNKHVKRKHLIIEKNFVCATCGARFAFKGELTNHSRKIHDKQKPKKKFTCKFCDKKYSCAKMVLIHERAIHTGERPAVCTVCKHSFTHEDYLKEHMRLHTGETPFKCPICGRGYAQRGNMKSHMVHNHKISDLDSITLANLKPSFLKHLKPC